MDVRQMIDFHAERGADLTVSALPVPVAAVSSFGVIEVDRDWRLISFAEKPAVPKEIPGRPGWALASMGNYVFQPASLIESLREDARRESAHDFGRNILPAMVGRSHCFVYFE